jgi:hypothetical protein
MDGRRDRFKGSFIPSSLYLITERTHWMTKSKKTFNEVLSSVKQFSLFFDNYRFWFLMSLCGFWFLMSLCENRVDFFIFKKISVGENLPNFLYLKNYIIIQFSRYSVVTHFRTVNFQNQFSLI